MKIWRTLCIALLFTSSITISVAAEAPDRMTKAALDDLARYQQQASGLSASRASSVRRTLKLVNLSYERLQQSPHRDHEVWQQADKGYTQLQTLLENMLNPQQSNSTQQTTQGGSNIGSSTPTSTNKASNTTTSTTSPAVQPLVSGQRVRVKKLAKDMAAVAASISTTGPSTFQNSGTIQALQKRFGQFKDAIARYPQVDDPDVITARAQFTNLQNTLRTEYARAQKQLETLGDVQARLRELENLLAQHQMPAALTPPFDQAAATGWVEMAGNARTVAEHTNTQLLAISEGAYLPETQGLPSAGALYERQDVDQLLGRSQQLFNSVQTTYSGMIQGMKAPMDTYHAEMDNRWQEDPESDKRWIFLDEQRQVEAYDYFDQASALGNSYIALESALNRDTSLGDKLVNRASQARANFERDFNIALTTSRMPESVSMDADLLNIAEAIVATPKYEFGKAGAIVLTTGEIVSRERKDSEVEFDDVDVSASGDIKLSGTETTWTYRWDEFKFAVPLQEASTGYWHIWWITARNYSSGGSNTPLGKWVSGVTSQGNRILEENI